MEPLCDFCGGVRAIVYCKSDAARLCLSCDESVHSANFLSRRHSRSLLCEKCNSQLAVIRCLDEKLSFCQGCDWNGNDCSSLGHRREALTFFTGCPSLAEFRRIWSSVLDACSPASSFDACSSVSALPAGDDNSVVNCLNQREQEDSFGFVGAKLDTLDPCHKEKGWMKPLSALIPTEENHMPYCKGQQSAFSGESDMPKGCSDLKDFKLPDGDDTCEGIGMNDVELNLDTAGEILDCLESQTNYQVESVGTNSLLMEKNFPVPESDGPAENILEASSTQPNDCLAFPFSEVGGSASAMAAMNGTSNCMLMNLDCYRNINLGYLASQVPSTISLSLSNISGEKGAADYQDSGLSPVFLACEPSWESNLEMSCPQTRYKAKMRYNEKKKTRLFGKQIRYASRKARADTRKRVKGRFVKVGEAYDYDPLVARNF